MDRFMPHGMCYLWRPDLVWLHVVSDTFIGLAYWAIPPALLYLVFKARRARPDGVGLDRLPYDWMFLAFGLFIVACGTTHLMAVWTVWQPVYWLSGGVKVVTAVASVATAVALPPLIPRALSLLERSRTSEERRAELERAHVALEEAHDRLREADRIKTEIFANVSHELRTPLSLILGPVERLLADPDRPPDERRQLEVVQRNGRTLLAQVNDLLDAAKTEARSQLETVFADVELSGLVLDVTENFSGLARDRELDLQVDAPELGTAQIDRDKIERVLLNLLSNAFKFTPDGGTIRVALSVEAGPTPVVSEDLDLRGTDRRAVLVVEDSGPGVPPEMRRVVFDRFRRAPGGGDAASGAGLGLAIARDFVRAHGGTIDLDDSPLGGARFTVRIPTEAPLGAPVVRPSPRTSWTEIELARLRSEAPPSPVDLTPSDATALGATRVLVVEDNQEMARHLAEVLRPDHRVSVAFDGEQGLARAVADPPDLIITDIMMPGLSGDRLVRELRSYPEFEHVPVMVLTAKADTELPARVLREGAQDYLIKPVAADELRARVRNLLELSLSRRILQREMESGQESLAQLAQEVAERKHQLETALEEKSVLLRELHHRVKGNLQTIGSLLNLQIRTVSDSAGREALEESRSRIAAMSLLHEKLYRSGDPSHVELAEYLRNLVRTVHRSVEGESGRREVTVDADRVELDVDRAMAVALLVHELVMNALRHGYPDDRAGRVRVHLHRRDGDVHLGVRDDGVGFAGKDPHDTDSMGLDLARALGRQLGGELELEDRNGVRATVRFPFTTARASAQGKE